MEKHDLLKAQLSGEISLDEWLRLLDSSNEGLISWSFPSIKHRDEYIETIDQRSIDEVHWLLGKFLMESVSLGVDEDYYVRLLSDAKENRELYSRKMQQEFYRRLVRYEISDRKLPPPWEGITWILDLLPDGAVEALSVVSAYIVAHAQQLPDGRWNGLEDAAVLIRAKFIGIPKTDADALPLVQTIPPRGFERLIWRLYLEMGYAAELTAPSRDGGRDVIARNNKKGSREHLLIECKRYASPISVKIVRSLLGVVSDEKVNKGVLVTTNRFTKASLEFAKRNPRIELIEGNELINLLNEHLGPRWSLELERLTSEAYSPAR